MPNVLLAYSSDDRPVDAYSVYRFVFLYFAVAMIVSIDNNNSDDSLNILFVFMIANVDSILKWARYEWISEYMWAKLAEMKQKR